LLAAEKREKELERDRLIMAQPAPSLIEKQPEVMEEITSSSPSLRNSGSTSISAPAPTPASTTTDGTQNIEKPAESPKTSMFGFGFRKKSWTARIANARALSANQWEANYGHNDEPQTINKELLVVWQLRILYSLPNKEFQEL
jgi:hypothetical protein